MHTTIEMSKSHLVMAAYSSRVTLALSTTFFFLLCVSNFSSVDSNGGFTIDLIHRDSPESPFYDPSQTPSQRLTNAVRRSFERVNHFNPKASSLSQSPNQAESTVIMNRGEYLMELSIGTPPFPIKAIADTGSDLIWTQCKPCLDCYKQIDPLFDPKKSSTYKTLPCSSTLCESLKGTCSEGPCQYSVRYGDSSHTEGDFAKDTVTLGSTTGKRNVSFPQTLIGCGHDNSGTFSERGSGIVGLGGGPASLITQIGSSIDGKFSYCLVPIFSQTTNTSKLNFGSNAVVSGPEVVSTPIVPDQDPKTFYYLQMEAISVGSTKIPFPTSEKEGNIIIDSGTTLTILPQEFYSQVEAAVDKAVGLQRVRNPEIGLSTCYKTSRSAEFKAPRITVHFSGADVELKQDNAFVSSVSDEVVCFAFGSSEEFAIYGNLAQMNFLVGYDLKKKTVSFKPTDCTKM